MGPRLEIQRRRIRPFWAGHWKTGMWCSPMIWISERHWHQPMLVVPVWSRFAANTCYLNGQRISHRRPEAVPAGTDRRRTFGDRTWQKSRPVPSVVRAGWKPCFLPWPSTPWTSGHTRTETCRTRQIMRVSPEQGMPARPSQRRSVTSCVIFPDIFSLPLASGQADPDLQSP